MIFRRKYKGLRHYERIRDKLTLREEPKGEVKQESDYRSYYNATANALDIDSTVMGCLPIMIGVGVIAATIGLLTGGLR